MSETPIILAGGGGHCRACIDVIEQSGTFRVAGIVEQPGKTDQGPVMGYPIIGDDDSLKDLRKEYHYALVTVGQIGSADVRRILFGTLETLGFMLPAIISPLAYVSKHARVGQGSIVMHRAVINAGGTVGDNCIINTAALIEHDACIGDHTHVSTAAVINGNAVIGTGSFVGSRAVVTHGANLPDNWFFKAGKRVVDSRDGTPVSG